MWERWFRLWLEAIFWWVPRAKDRTDEETAASEARSRDSGTAEAPSTDRPATAAAEQEGEPQPLSPDDLTIIKGVGPAMQRKLEAAGIATFRDLAQADAQALTDKLKPFQRTLTKDTVEGWIEAARTIAEVPPD